MDHLSIAPEKPVQLFARPRPQPGDQLHVYNYDDLRRTRLTVGFRGFMAIPHLLWLGIWGGGMAVLSPVFWIWTLIKGEPPEDLREVYAMWIRYATHVYAYWYLGAERFPEFLGKTTYPVDVELPPGARQNRWSIGFRLFLAIPPLTLAGSLIGGGLSALFTYGFSSGVAVIAAFGAWFYVMARGRMPQGIRDLVVWSVGYAAQTYAYAFLLTGRYPNSDPAVVPLAPVPAHPVRLELTDELRRNRWLVGFRYVLSTPHSLWWTLWTALMLPLSIVGWLVALVLGRLPRPLHRFFSAWVRYSAHLNAFYYMAGGLFPGFLGRHGSYPVDIAIDGAERQSRWTIAFRAILALPALMLAGTLLGVVTLLAIGGWFFALVMGRMPRGIRNVNAFALRYVAQTFSYLLLVTPRYPYSGPGDFHG
ncbi:MAG TPA: DUF4389 domain-containing protein [Solirubrobacteraceae bacterium]